MRSVTVDKIGLDVQGDQAVVFLKEPEGHKVLPIWIGMQEATAIAIELQGQKASRPLTVDLLKTILDTFDARVLMVVINDMKDGIFVSRLFLRAASSTATGGSTVEVDARPSDALALALRCDAPVYVAEWILDKESIDEPEEDEYGDEDESEGDHTSH